MNTAAQCQQRSLALANSITSSAQYSPFAERNLWNVGWGASCRLDARKFHHLGPLLGIVLYKPAKVSGRAGKHRATQVG